MHDKIDRRRFLQIAAAATLLPGTGFAATTDFSWRGAALGARASMVFAGVDEARGRNIAARVQAEIDRLERIFSLYRADSAIATLNARGRLDGPPAELLEALSLCNALVAATGGAFDPTVQPVWRLHAERLQRGTGPSPDEVAAVCGAVGWDKIVFNPDAVAFGRPGMAITLNGVAQGYITDRIAALLRAEGLRDVLIDMGEIAATGGHGDGSPWRAGIADPQGRIVRRIELRDRALATSAPRGTVLDPAGRIGHIFDPRTGATAEGWNLVSVSAPTAAVADGLSTGLCLLPRARIDDALARFAESRIEAIS